MPQEICENKPSVLLYKEDNEQIFTLLGVRCQTLVTTVIQLYVTEPPNHSQWIKKDTGVLCFVKDNYRKNYFFRLYCPKRNSMIWEHEVYNNMEYYSSCDFLHTFEGEGCMIAFNFANTAEAKELKTVVDRKLLTKKRREEKRNLRNSVNIQQEQSPRLPTSNDLMMYKKTSDPAERKAKRRRNITKADIGNPSEFRHVSHVGWDPDKGFDIACDDPQLRQFFQKAGVSEKQLQDKDTREFIYDFINKHGGREAVQEEVQKASRKPAPAPPSPIAGPPVPPRGTGRSHNRAAPPPPPTPSLGPRVQPPTITTKSSTSGACIPPPPPGAAPPPPPPPPLPSSEMPLPEMPSLPPIASSNEILPAPDMRTALMESIRGGTTLKHIDVDKKPSSDTTRGDLMSEIRKGFQLKPTTEREVKPVSPPANQGRGDLAGALARALAERSRVIHSEDDSTSDTDSNDEEWDA